MHRRRATVGRVSARRGQGVSDHDLPLLEVVNVLHLGAGRRVGLHLLELPGGQLVRLAEDGIGNRDPAEVVQRCGEAASSTFASDSPTCWAMVTDRSPTRRVCWPVSSSRNSAAAARRASISKGRGSSPSSGIAAMPATAVLGFAEPPFRSHGAATRRRERAVRTAQTAHLCPTACPTRGAGSPGFRPGRPNRLAFAIAPYTSPAREGSRAAWAGQSGQSYAGSLRQRHPNLQAGRPGRVIRRRRASAYTR